MPKIRNTWEFIPTMTSETSQKERMQIWSDWGMQMWLGFHLGGPVITRLTLLVIMHGDMISMAFLAWK